MFIRKTKMPGHPDPVHRRDQVESHTEAVTETEASRRNLLVPHITGSL